jgi:hypothetical protein
MDGATTEARLRSELDSFGRALAGLPDNPLARREWRALMHQASDWKLWVGLRMPKDARGWGMPAIAWFVLAPYVVWAALAAGTRAAPGFFRPAATPGPYAVDVLALCLALLGFYVCLTALALMAPAITRERENETWEGLRSTVASSHDILLGLAAGRLGPVLASYFAVGLVWTLARPHYAALLQPLAPFGLDRPQLALAVWETIAFALAVAGVATAASAWSRTTGLAVVLSVAATLLLMALLGLLVVMLPAVPATLIILGVSLPAAVAGYVAALRRLA